MSLHITKKGIRATGSDANGLFIALSSDLQLLESEKKKTGSPEFQRMVKEAIAARNISLCPACECVKDKNGCGCNPPDA